MMAPPLPGSRVGADASRDEYELPRPRALGLGILPREGIGKLDRSEARGPVALEDCPARLDMAAQRGGQPIGERDHAILPALAAAHADAAMREIDVLDPQPQALHQPETRAVLERGDQPVLTAQPRQRRAHLAGREHDRQPPGRPRAHHTAEIPEGPVEHRLVEKHQRVERLVLRGRRDAPLHGQKGQELSHLTLAHVGRVALAVVQNEPFGPVNVGILGAQAIVPRPNRLTDAAQKRRRLPAGHGADPPWSHCICVQYRAIRAGSRPATGCGLPPISGPCRWQAQRWSDAGGRTILKCNEIYRRTGRRALDPPGERNHNRWQSAAF